MVLMNTSLYLIFPYRTSTKFIGIASAVLLYGMALVFGSTGTTQFAEIAVAVQGLGASGVAAIATRTQPSGAHELMVNIAPLPSRSPWLMAIGTGLAGLALGLSVGWAIKR